MLPAGVVLTGGSAQVDGLSTLAREVLGMPVRIGAPSSISGLVDSISNPAFSTSVGLLAWGLRGMEERAGKIRSHLEIRSKVDGGTEIELVVPGRIAYEGALGKSDRRTLTSSIGRHDQ